MLLAYKTVCETCLLNWRGMFFCFKSRRCEIKTLYLKNWKSRFNQGIKPQTECEKYGSGLIAFWDYRIIKWQKDFCSKYSYVNIQINIYFPFKAKPKRDLVSSVIFTQSPALQRFLKIFFRFKLSDWIFFQVAQYAIWNIIKQS